MHGRTKQRDFEAKENQNPDESKETIRQCSDTYRRIFQEKLLTMKPQAFPNVIETLSALKEQGYTLTIASSRWHNSLAELTHDMRIGHYISYLVGADDVENAKPNPEPVLKTLSATGFEAFFTASPRAINTPQQLPTRARIRERYLHQLHQLHQKSGRWKVDS